MCLQDMTPPPPPPFREQMRGGSKTQLGAITGRRERRPSPLKSISRAGLVVVGERGTSCRGRPRRTAPSGAACGLTPGRDMKEPEHG
ncbi:hypothetical protein LDENG_00164490 [Lucifuga dentata]|nr:hypothetical protein LDENG_00164490 [Lucifuga dentata]